MGNYVSPGSPVTHEQARAKLLAAIDRATHKAHEQARTGNVPTLLRSFTSPDGLEQRQFWTVGSRTTGGVVYDVTLTADADGLKTLCHCDGATAGRICWHRAAVRLAALGELECHRATWPTVRLPALATPDPWPADLDDATAYAAAV